jgi:hypothetical protein
MGVIFYKRACSKVAFAKHMRLFLADGFFSGIWILRDLEVEVRRQ